MIIFIIYDMELKMCESVSFIFFCFLKACFLEGLNSGTTLMFFRRVKLRYNLDDDRGLLVNRVFIIPNGLLCIFFLHILEFL